nr:tRNA (cytidine(34)-2'-O)-methyltransferase [Persicirhabdus sediminis]
MNFGYDQRKMFQIVLHNPEIPHNAGAAGRLSLATGATLHLIEPLGFSLDEKAVRRAGLDYWKEVDLHVWPSWENFLENLPAESRLFYLTTKTKHAHWDHQFEKGDYLVFGCETRGLPEPILHANPDRCLTIPMQENSTRSLNLSTAIAIVLFEGMRQVSS